MIWAKVAWYDSVQDNKIIFLFALLKEEKVLVLCVYWHEAAYQLVLPLSKQCSELWEWGIKMFAFILMRVDNNVI